MKTLSGLAGTENRHARSEYRQLFDTTIAYTFQQALWIIHSSPDLLLHGTKIAWHQKKAADTRQEFEQQGLFVPPVVIISITSRCNLACAGCYMKQQREYNTPEMSQDLLRSVIAEAADLGVSVIVIAGGEPLLRKDKILSITRLFPQILFPLFTNGLMIDSDSAWEIAKQKNIVPLISFEGFRHDTDSRQGQRSLRTFVVVMFCLKKEWYILRVFGYRHPCEHCPCYGRRFYPRNDGGRRPGIYLRRICVDRAGHRRPCADPRPAKSPARPYVSTREAISSDVHRFFLG